MALDTTSHLSRSNTHKFGNKEQYGLNLVRSNTITSQSHSRSDSNSSQNNSWNSPSKRPATVVITGQNQTCAICHLAVYPAEQCLIDSFSVHPNCFRCRHCNQLLSLSSNEKIDGSFYCKAHYKLYSNGNSEVNTLNPLLANASYASSIPLAIEAQEAVGKTITNKKAAYESLVKASTTTVLDSVLDPGLKSLRNSLGFNNPIKVNKRTGLPLRSKSILNLHTFANKDAKPYSESIFDVKKKERDSFPVSKIVQTCLNIYESKSGSALPEKKEANTVSPIKRSLSSGPNVSTSSAVTSTPTQRATTISAFPTPMMPLKSTTNTLKRTPTLDPSLSAAQRTNLKDRMLPFKNLKDNDISVNSTFKEKGTINTKASFRMGIERFSNKKVEEPKPVSLANMPEKVHANGSFVGRDTYDDTDLKIILTEINKISPSPQVKKVILDACCSLNDKLKAKDDEIDQLHARINILETKLQAVLN